MASCKSNSVDAGQLSSASDNTYYQTFKMMPHTARIVVAGLSLAAVAGAAPTASACFPYGSATLPKDLSTPNVSLSDWWCPQSMAYGFQGFSYPLEDNDCSAHSNSFDAISADFARMKADFGASIARIYYPTCTKASVFENILRAGVANNMAVIFQVWTNFGDGVSSTVAFV
jgi:hypothetical protein